MIVRSARPRAGIACPLLLLAASFMCPASAAAQTLAGGAVQDGWLGRAAFAAAPTIADPAASPAEQEAPAYHDYLPALGYSFTHGLFTREQLLPLAVGSAAALALLPADRKISDRARGKSMGLGRAGEIAGSPITLGALGGGLVVGSLATGDQTFRGYAFTLSQGIIVAESLSGALKLAVRRTRPDGTSRVSFPSGHAAGSFALAAVSAHYYGAKAGIPLYALAALVGVSRITYGKHFPSDVVFGAAVGYISATAAIRGTQHVAGAGKDTSGLAAGSRALVFSLRF